MRLFWLTSLKFFRCYRVEVFAPEVTLIMLLAALENF